MDRIQSAVGLLTLILIGWLLSENRRRVDFRVVAGSLLLQFSLALLLLKTAFFKDCFLYLNQVAKTLQDASLAGTRFAFGYIGGGEPPFQVTNPGNLFVFAFQGLPMVLLISALSSLLFHWGGLPKIVRCISYVLRKATGVSGAVALGVAANIFVGMVEAPLMIRPYVSKASRSELFTLMVSGMATVAGTVMFLYAMILSKIINGAMGHILVASVISAPAAIMVSLLMVPGDFGKNKNSEEFVPPKTAESTMDALVKGVDAGVKLLISIVAMVVVMVALVYLLNAFLGLIPVEEPLTFQRLVGWCMAPVVWLIGVPWVESNAAGQLMGTKIVLNELIAYVDMANLPPEVLSERSRIIMMYAMCGFANFASLGIMIAGLRSIAPEKEKEILSLGPKSILAGVIATLMTGAVAGILL
jgi:CNT family concentrative nucleoside transporter